MQVVLARFDGCFFIGQIFNETTTPRNNFFNPALVLHVPVQVEKRIVAYQTTIVFIESHIFRLPDSVVITELGSNESLTKHYLAALDIYRKTSPDFFSDEQKH